MDQGSPVTEPRSPLNSGKLGLRTAFPFPIVKLGSCTPLPCFALEFPPEHDFQDR